MFWDLRLHSSSEFRHGSENSYAFTCLLVHTFREELEPQSCLRHS